MRPILGWTCLTAAVVWAASGASALAEKGNDRGKGDPDQRFVRIAASAGMAEVKLGQLGVKRARSADVKKFAQRMVDDHTRANQQLMDLVSQKGMRAPTMLDAKHQVVMDRLSKLDGDEFDREFMNVMVKDHHKAVDLFEKEAQSGADPALKGFAEKTLPTLRDHLKMAEDLARGK